MENEKSVREEYQGSLWSACAGLSLPSATILQAMRKPVQKDSSSRTVTTLSGVPRQYNCTGLSYLTELITWDRRR